MTKFPIHEVVPHTLAVSNHNTLFERLFFMPRREKDKFDGRNVEWKDYCLIWPSSFVSSGNRWSSYEEAICLKGSAQMMFGNLVMG